MIKEIMCLLFLTANGIRDLRTGTVIGWTIPVFILFGIINHIFAGDNERLHFEIITALIPGLLLLLIGKVTKEAVGYGDGLIMIALGTVIDLWEVSGILVGGLFLSAAAGVVLLILKKSEKNDGIPWIPCVWIVYVGRLVSRLL